MAAGSTVRGVCCRNRAATMPCVSPWSTAGSEDIAQAMSRAFGSESPFVEDPLTPFMQTLGPAELTTNVFRLGSDFLSNQAC